MKSTTYSEKVLDHFRAPRNVGTLEGEGVAMGRVGNPVCGDLMEMYIQVEDNIIKDVKFKTFGCGSAVATSSMITEMAVGKTLEEALRITRGDVADELEGLPPIKMHCSNLAADALHAAIKNYMAAGKEKEQEPEIPEEEGLFCRKVGNEKIKDEEKYIGKGLYDYVDDPAKFAGKRVVIFAREKEAYDKAIELTEHTPRVVLITRLKEESLPGDILKKLKTSGVKIIFESEIVQVKGEDEVEKIRVHDHDEDEEYELYVDGVIVL